MKSTFTLIFAILALSACATNKHDAAPIAPAPTSPAVSQAVATPTAESNSEVVTCSSGKDVRKLEVAKKDSGCSFDYTKLGKTSSAATAKQGLKHCEDSKMKTRKNLEAAGFKCA